MLVSIAKGFEFRIFLANWLITTPHERLCFCSKVQSHEHYLFLLRMLFALLVISRFHYHHLPNRRKKKNRVLYANYSFAFLHNFTVYVWICKQHIFKKTFYKWNNIFFCIFSFHSVLFLRRSHAYSLYEKIYWHVLILMDIWVVCFSEGCFYEPFYVHWQFFRSAYKAIKLMGHRMCLSIALVWMAKLFPSVCTKLSLCQQWMSCSSCSKTSSTLGIFWPLFFCQSAGFEWYLINIYN